ncbi:MAG: hypothetical protein WA695_00645 [Candidatus Dormiibacterota bacterium]
MTANDPDLTRNSESDEGEDSEGHRLILQKEITETDEADDSEGHRFGSPRLSRDSDEADDSPGQLTRSGH